jgi:aminomethyltransferase
VLTSDPDLLAAIGPRVRTSPFYASTLAAGLSAVSAYNHMWLPMGYGDPDEEYRRLTTGVSMWDVAAQRHIEVRGSDADELVQYVTTIDVRGVPEGSGAYAPVVDHAGVLINDPVVLHWLDGSWRFSIADSDLGLWLRTVAHFRDLTVEIRELDTATLAVQGPQADAVMADLGVGWPSTVEHLEFRAEQLPGAGRPLDVVVSRSGWSTQGGVEIFLDDPDRADDLWRTVEAAGVAHDIGPGAPNATERIENVLLSYGTDTGYDADPLELGLESHLDLDGPDFIGRTALRRRRDEGPRRHLLGVVLDGPAIGTLPSPAPLTVDTAPIGELRAAVHSPRFDRNIGLALVSASHGPGTEGEVVRNDEERTVHLVELPFAQSLSG